MSNIVNPFSIVTQVQNYDSKLFKKVAELFLLCKKYNVTPVNKLPRPILIDILHRSISEASKEKIIYELLNKDNLENVLNKKFDTNFVTQKKAIINILENAYDVTSGVSKNEGAEYLLKQYLLDIDFDFDSLNISKLPDELLIEFTVKLMKTHYQLPSKLEKSQLFKGCINEDFIELFLEWNLNPGITEIEFKSNQLKLIPSTIKNLENLVVLDLSNNQLIDLPLEMAYLKNLKKLDLSKNNLRFFSPIIEKLENLVVLDLSNNRLSSVSSGIEKLQNLKTLDLSNCDLNDLPLEIRNCENLISLNFYNNKFVSLPLGVLNFKGLKNLNLSKCNLGSISSEMGNLKNLENLEILDLSNNDLVDFPLETINSKNLKDLVISHNKITILSSKIEEFTKLESLDISHNELSSLPIEIKNCEELNDFNLANNKALGLQSVTLETRKEVEKFFKKMKK